MVRVRNLFLLLGGLLALASSPAAADEGWNLYATKLGVRYSRRSVPGSRFYEYLAVTTVPESPDVVLRTIWNGIIDAPPPTLKRRTVLLRTPSEIVVYDHVHAPVVTDRDVVLRIRQQRRGQIIDVTFEAASDVGPPPQPGLVRLGAVRGAWKILPGAAGGTELSYRCYSEPGGSVPAFIARGVQQDQVELDVGGILDRLRRR